MNSIREALSEETSRYVHGISANFGQFLLQLLQVFFVGLTIGLQRNVVPALAEEQFGVPRDSFKRDYAVPIDPRCCLCRRVYWSFWMHL
jgi:hypothetical protein